eukprot:TRINITY_DN11638_c0_g1_i2.p1 TRINITY_DN11638_c0_g1~~TRINITY_DN11638_c0_g1_i2.p1  ORF type:complete len:286 (-),score=40.58 TRINITY_DN11638_c0_g1_i2:75-905(-)
MDVPLMPTCPPPKRPVKCRCTKCRWRDARDASGACSTSVGLWSSPRLGSPASSTSSRELAMQPAAPETADAGQQTEVHETEEDASCCPICLQGFRPRDGSAVIACGQCAGKIHLKCYGKLLRGSWSKRSNQECPMCRQPFHNASDSSDDDEASQDGAGLVMDFLGYGQASLEYSLLTAMSQGQNGRLGRASNFLQHSQQTDEVQQLLEENAILEVETSDLLYATHDRQAIRDLLRSSHTRRLQLGERIAASLTRTSPPRQVQRASYDTNSIAATIM